MIRSLGKLSLATVLAALVIGLPMTVSAQTNSTLTNSTSKSTANGVKYIPAGKVASVDAADKSFTIVSKKKFSVTADTVIMVDGKKGTLADVVKGQKVSGSYTVAADGSNNAKSLKFTTPQAAPAK